MGDSFSDLVTISRKSQKVSSPALLPLVLLNTGQGAIGRLVKFEAQSAEIERLTEEAAQAAGSGDGLIRHAGETPVLRVSAWRVQSPKQVQTGHACFCPYS